MWMLMEDQIRGAGSLRKGGCAKAKIDIGRTSFLIERASHFSRFPRTEPHHHIASTLAYISYYSLRSLMNLSLLKK